MSEEQINQQQLDLKDQQMILDKKVTKKRQLLGAFDRYQYMVKSLQPFKQQLTEKLRRRHNEYHYNILNNKIKCYEKFSTDPIAYYECFEKVQAMVDTNYTKLHGHCQGLNYVLDNCLQRCSKKSSKNEQFEQCAKGKGGCFEEYQNRARGLYKKMYKILLEKEKQ